MPDDTETTDATTTAASGAPATPPAASPAATPTALCARCGLEDGRPLACGHGIGPRCEDRDGAEPCPTCTGRKGVDWMPAKGDEE